VSKLSSLENVNALALPAKVLVLLSKYAKSLRAHNGTVLKLSSLRVFRHIHVTCMKASSPKLNEIYSELLEEVDLHIKAGTMYTNDAKDLMLKKQKKQTLRKLNSKISNSIIQRKKTSNRILTADH